MVRMSLISSSAPRRLIYRLDASIKPAYLERMMERPSYVNGKGRTVILEVSHHAYLQFQHRWELLLGERLDGERLDAVLVEQFKRAHRLQNLKEVERRRIRRHGTGTLFFRTQGFTFVVKDGTIITVEVSDRDSRHLNKI